MYSIRLATLDDAGIIARHRHRMFLDIGDHNRKKLEAMTEAFQPWLESRMAYGNYLGWRYPRMDRWRRGWVCG